MNPRKYKNSYYLVYPDGRVYSEKTKKFLKPYTSTNGYLIFDLRVENKYERSGGHQLVARCFVENPNKYPCVLHKNDIRDDNRLENLMWGTHQMNIRQAFERGRMRNRPTPQGEKNRKARFKMKDILKMRELSKKGMSNKDIGTKFKTSLAYAWKVVNGVSWKHL